MEPSRQMIQSRLFRKHYLTSAIVLVSFIFLGLLMNILIVRLSSKFDGNRPTFFARLFDYMDHEHRDRAFNIMESMRDRPLPYQIGIVSDKGEMIVPQGLKVGFDWKSIEPPTEPYHFVQIGTSYEVIRFDGAPTQYLYIDSSQMQEQKPQLIPIVESFLILVVSVLIGVGCALFLLFRSVRDRVEAADFVINELHKGNLKARFPIKKRDEFGPAIMRFNLMADEIERLVERLKSVESSRMSLLQELAHDLRTPVASLKNLLETIHTKQESIKPEVQTELMTLALKEVDYFERLVEDLLILAQVSEPRYHAKQAPIPFRALLDEESEGVAVKYARLKEITLVKHLPENLEVYGDPLLLRRLIRNAVDNAFSFAKSSVTLNVRELEKEIEILVEDDGSGLSKEALNSFGQRQMTRFLGTSNEGRLSVGLGSVIMKTVAELHRGTVNASNRTDANDSIVGARIQILLPRI
jgi:signal transduction histidine kinase